MVFQWKMMIFHYFPIIFNIFSSLTRLWSSPTVVRWPRWIFCSIQIVYMNQRDSFPALLSSKTYRDRSDEITKNFDFFSKKFRIDFFSTFSLKSLVKLIFRLFRLFSIFSIFPRIFDFAKDFFEKISSRIFFGLKKNSFHFFSRPSNFFASWWILDRTKVLESPEPPLSFKHHFSRCLGKSSVRKTWLLCVVLESQINSNFGLWRFINSVPHCSEQCRSVAAPPHGWG